VSVRLNKTVAIARSGVYVYSAEEVSSLGLSVPPEMKGKRAFGVYRPATVVADAAALFVKLPVTLEHPKEAVVPSNFMKYARGYTGDTAVVEYLKDQNEVAIRSTLTLADEASMNAYYKGIVEVSPGYAAAFAWDSGVSPNGEKYDIVMKKILEVNHLALTRAGRGGASACILDSTGVFMKKRQSGIFYAIHKMLGGVKDGSGDSFTEKLAKIIKDRLTMDDKAMAEAVSDLQMVVDSLPDSADKNKLVRYLADLVHVNKEGDEAANQYGIMIGNLFCTLDAAATLDAPAVGDAYDKPKDKTEEENPAEEVAEEKPAEEKPGEAPVEEKPGEEKPGEEKTGEEPEAGETEAHEEAETPEEEKEEHEKPAMVGIDDTIYDKGCNELSEQEHEYLHKKTMEMLKDYLLTKAAAEAVVDAKPEEEAPVADSAEQKPNLDDNKEARYPSSARIDSSGDIKGVDVNEIFKTLKGRAK